MNSLILAALMDAVLARPLGQPSHYSLTDTVIIRVRIYQEVISAFVMKDTHWIPTTELVQVGQHPELTVVIHSW